MTTPPPYEPSAETPVQQCAGCGDPGVMGPQGFTLIRNYGNDRDPMTRAEMDALPSGEAQTLEGET